MIPDHHAVPFAFNLWSGDSFSMRIRFFCVYRFFKLSSGTILLVSSSFQDFSNLLRVVASFILLVMKMRSSSCLFFIWHGSREQRSTIELRVRFGRKEVPADFSRTSRLTWYSLRVCLVESIGALGTTNTPTPTVSAGLPLDSSTAITLNKCVGTATKFCPMTWKRKRGFF